MNPSIFIHMDWLIKVRAAAKINLHLQVFPVRKDGYHDLRSLFVMVSLFDELRVRPADHGECVIAGMEGISREENLIWKAHSAFVRETGQRIGVEVACRKMVPPLSGLGGGSSDAAAMLRCMVLAAEKTGKNFPGEERLREIAAELGSDVPFFLGGSAARAEGRGEVLRSIRVPVEYPVVLVRPEPDIATGEAYGLLDASEGREEPELSAEEMERQFLRRKPEKWNFFNSFTGVIGRRYPEIESLINQLYLDGADYVNMSGSGSAVFGVFSREETAAKAAERLKKMRKKVWKLKMLASAPEAVYNKTG